MSHARVIPHGSVNAVWPDVHQMLESALGMGNGELDVSQLRLLLVQQRAELLTLIDNDGDLCGAFVFEIHDYPNLRVAHVIAAGGKGLVGLSDAWRNIKGWLREERGCQELRGFVSEAGARLWRKLGCDEIYRVVRTKL